MQAMGIVIVRRVFPMLSLLVLAVLLPGSFGRANVGGPSYSAARATASPVPTFNARQRSPQGETAGSAAPDFEVGCPNVNCNWYPGSCETGACGGCVNGDYGHGKGDEEDFYQCQDGETCEIFMACYCMWV